MAETHSINVRVTVQACDDGRLGVLMTWAAPHRNGCGCVECDDGQIECGCPPQCEFDFTHDFAVDFEIPLEVVGAEARVLGARPTHADPASQD